MIEFKEGYIEDSLWNSTDYLWNLVQASWVCFLLPNNILTLSWPCQVYSGHWKSNLLHLSLKVTNFPFAGMRCNSNCHNGQMINLCVVPFFIQTIMAWISLIFFENISFFFTFWVKCFYSIICDNFTQQFLGCRCLSSYCFSFDLAALKCLKFTSFPSTNTRSDLQAIAKESTFPRISWQTQCNIERVYW